MLDDHLDMTLDPAEEERNAQIDALRDQLADHLTRLDHHAVAALSTLARLRADDVYDIEYVEGTGAPQRSYTTSNPCNTRSRPSVP